MGIACQTFSSFVCLSLQVLLPITLTDQGDGKGAGMAANNHSGERVPAKVEDNPYAVHQ